MLAQPETTVAKSGKNHLLIHNDAYQIDVYFHDYPDSAKTPIASYRFDRLGSEDVVPIRFQYVRNVKDMAHAEKIGRCFLRHWSRQHAEAGITGCVPPEELLLPDEKAA